MKVLAMVVVVFAVVGCSDAKFNGQTSADKKPATATPVATPQPATPQPTTTPSTSDVVPGAPPSAVTQGSFTVWSDPENPQCRAYKIHIRVKLPSNTVNYARNDLSGNLIGTDGYTQNLQDQNLWTVIGGGKFSFAAGSAELVVPVPAAENQVKDTIQVRSNLLNENQTLVVTFGNGQAQPCDHSNWL